MTERPLMSARLPGAALMAVVALAVLVAPSATAAQELYNRSYGPDPRHRLDLFVPGSVKSGERRKVVLYFHGGAWKYGDTPGHRFVGRALAAKGYVAAVSTYRLYPQVKFPAFVHDAARAVAWIRAHVARFGGDPDRIYLMGHSAGAHIAALVALDPRYMKAAGVPRRALAGVIGLAGPYVFNPKGWSAIAPVFDAHPNPSARPVDFVRRFRTLGGPRLLLLQGADDRLARMHEGPGLARAYRAVGGKATVKTYRGVGHNGVLLAIARPMRWRAPVLKDIVAWIGRP